MGLLDGAMKRLQRVIGGSAERTSRTSSTSSTTKQTGKRPAWGGRDPDRADYGRAGAPTPDMDGLVTDGEIEAVTGGSPVGEPRRNGDEGSEVDLGRRVIRESKLSNGDEFLLSLGNCTNAAAAQLAMDRVAEVEKPLEGVGERGLIRVKTYPKTGGSEIGVTALQGNFTVSLVHTSRTGKTDAAPLIELLRKVLTRL